MIECSFFSHFPQMVWLGKMLWYFRFCFGKSQCNIREKMLSIIWSICLAVQRAQVRLKVNNYSRQWFEMLCVVVCVRAIKCTWFDVCCFFLLSVVIRKTTLLFNSIHQIHNETWNENFVFFIRLYTDEIYFIIIELFLCINVYCLRHIGVRQCNFKQRLRLLNGASPASQEAIGIRRSCLFWKIYRMFNLYFLSNQQLTNKTPFNSV